MSPLNFTPFMFAYGLDKFRSANDLASIYDSSIPTPLLPHFKAWKKHAPNFLPHQSHKSSTFKSLIPYPDTPKRHSLPSIIPLKWNNIYSLHVPAGTKSFMLKLYWNSLPTHDRLVKFSDTPPFCPFCHLPLTLDHFLTIPCYINILTSVKTWARKHGLPTVYFKVKTFTPLNLIFIYPPRISKNINCYICK